MTKEQIMRRLLHHFSLHNKAEAIELLEKYSNDIDLTHSDGLFFILAINNKDPELLEVLTQCFEKKRLKNDTNYEDYTEALEFLDFVFEILTDKDDPIAFKASPKTWQIMHKYLDENSDIEDGMDPCEDESRDSNNISAISDHFSDLTEENLKHWNELHMPSLPLHLSDQSKALVDIADQQVLEGKLLGVIDDNMEESL
jgi:hypothetical protein